MELKNKILVIGDSCDDVYIYGDCNRLSPEKPIPVFVPRKEVKSGGMSKNVFRNISSLGLSCDHITNDEYITKTRYVDIITNHMFIRVDSNDDNIKRIKNISMIPFTDYGCVVISDYCKGFLTEEDIEFICSKHSNVFIDTKRPLGKYCHKAKYIKINNIEYEKTKPTIDNVLKEKLIITVGKNGCKHKNINYEVDNVEIKDLSGAGDSFLSALVSHFLLNDNIEEAIIFANKCATEVVQKKGVVAVGDYINIKGEKK